MLDKQKESLRKLSRLDQDPKRLKILRKHLGKVDRSKDLGTTRQYIAPNSALIAKGGRILFESKEMVLGYLQNTDRDIINLTRGDKYFNRSLNEFLDNSIVIHPIYDTELIGFTALSPEATKLCREDYHYDINQKISNGEIPNKDQEFDFMVNSIIANPENLGKALERGHNDTNLGTHIFKSKISDIYMDMILDLHDLAESSNKYKSEYDHTITEVINSVIRKGYRSAGRKIRNPVRKLLDEIIFDNEFLRPINYSSRLDDLTELNYNLLNKELDLKLPLDRKGIPIISTGSANNHAVISTYNRIGRGFSNPI